MKYAFTTASLLALAAAEVHQVTVGPGLSYSPDSLTAADGDVVSFTFGSGHDVVSGSFDSPCENNGKIYSGMPNEGDVFSVTVNGTDPIWIYCSVPGHCQGGMAMVINAPSGKTIDDYKSAASSAGGSNAPSSMTGGVFGAVSDSSSPSASASSSSSSATDSSGYGSTSTSAAASPSATGSGNGVGNVVVPLSLVAGAFAGGLAMLL